MKLVPSSRSSGQRHTESPTSKLAPIRRMSTLMINHNESKERLQTEVFIKLRCDGNLRRQDQRSFVGVKNLNIIRFPSASEVG